jgi:hypothetical protein
MLSMLQNPRQAAAQALNFALVLTTAFMVRILAGDGGLPDYVANQEMVADVERSLRSCRLAIPDRRRSLRLHGACFPKRRPALPLEPESDSRDECWRGGCLQRQGQGHPYRSQNRPQIRRWVSNAWRDEISLPLHCLTSPRPDAKILTKGDNNAADDTELFARGQDFLERSDIIGSVVGYIPFVGYVTILLSEHPWLKTVLLGFMGFLAMIQRE